MKQSTQFRQITLAGTVVLLLLAGTAAPVHAMQRQDKGNRQQQHVQQSQQGRQQQRVYQQGQNRQQQQRVHQSQQGQSRQQRVYQQGQNRPQQRIQQRTVRPSQQGPRVRQADYRGTWQQHRAHSWQSEHRTWQQRGGYHGYRIPQDRYRRYFGHDHWFRIHGRPLFVVGGYPRFWYGGFWFSLVDPWPEYWSDNWYDTDDVYVEYYGDGYYLYNRRHPLDRIAVTVFVR